MTHSRNASASSAIRKATLPADGYEGRSLRARADPMAVRPLRDRRYVVETDSGTYVVDLEERSCTCPDYAIRGARCKHLRRVAIEVNERRQPAPTERRSVCAVCGQSVFVPFETTGPQLCADDDFESGEFVRDRESGSALVVTNVVHRRADEVVVEDGTSRTVADYETNADYGDHEPVVEAVYLGSVRAVDGELEFDRARRYSFPASRLRHVDREETDRPRPDSFQSQFPLAEA
ncbi:SWIM zinc finger family protein [Haloprofundus salinisoli]|uniref:SWIM zinc finger family protein n=1 Tax=Haloprofundus salinisoli TaxID=2876193 RepID=UPI001CCD434B|nr:SWIM zinc finger family protein [Haloprofundus salinisoli]